MIKKIRLINFKCFEDETINISALNLFSGINGMGKSTVLQALLLLRQNHEIGLLKKSKVISLNGNLVQIGNVSDLLYQYFKKREVGIELEIQNNRTTKWVWDTNTDNDIFTCKFIEHNNKGVNASTLFKSNFHYLNAERLGPRVYYMTHNYEVNNQNQLGVRGEYTVNYLARFQNNDISIKKLKHFKENGNTLYEQVNAWLGEIRPGTRISVTEHPNMSLVELNYQFIGGKDISNKFRPTNVGFGLSYVLSIIVAILSSKPGTLILLENPEAHLHPKGQAELGKLFALASNNGIQIIVETHSDHILNGVRVAVKEGLIKPENTNILFFTGEVIENKFIHHIENLKIDINGRIDYWPTGFFDEWDNQLNNLL